MDNNMIPNLMLPDEEPVKAPEAAPAASAAAVQEAPVQQPSAPAAAEPVPKQVNFSGVTAEEQKLLEPLLAGERTVDDLIAASGLAPQKALAMLTMLELKGMVTTLPGRRVTLS